MDPHSEILREMRPDQAADRSPHAAATLERLFRITPAILHSIDSTGRLIAVSDAWLTKFGYLREEVLGRKSIEFLTEKSKQYAMREVLPAFFRDGRLDNIEYQMVRKDGEVLDVLLSAVLDPGDADHGACSLAVISDVTALRKVERRLAESEALYKGIVESQADLVSLATPSGELTFVNHAYTQQYDLQPSELIGKNLLDFVPTEARATVQEQLRRVCDLNEAVESENQVVMPNGQTRWMAWTNRALLDDDGRVTAIHSVGRDVERRVVAEQKMKVSERCYRMLAESSSDVVILVRIDGKRMYVSPACSKLLGWSPEEMLATRTQDMVHPDDVTRLRHVFADPREDNLTMTYRLRRRDGAYVWVEATSQPVEVPGEHLHRLLVVRDVERRIEAERRLKESEATYRLLADNSSAMVFQLDRRLAFRYVSPASREIIGYEPAELIGLEPIRQCHPDDAERVAKAFQAMLEGKVEHMSTVNRRRHRDGHWIWVEVQLKALRDPDTSEISGITGALVDISLRKSIEDQLAAAHRRLEIQAAQDGLTGLANRRTFDEALAREHLRAAREKTSLALIILDVDRFKSLNDRYGHPAGDRCLKQIADAIAGAIYRPGDLAARYGGEEFVVLLPNTDEPGAAEIAERIRLAVRFLGLTNDAGVDRIVTISAGVSALRCGRDASFDQLLKDADRALYRAKRSGRDQVVNASWLVGRDSGVERNSHCERI